MKRLTIIISGILTLLWVVNEIAFGQNVAVVDILKHSDRARGNVGGIIWDISITTNEEGSVETRGMTVKVKGSDTLARYTSPAAMNDR
ncbi:MAG TPA: hypothetical protein VLG72_05820, partial [Nitrospirota bacterium]|nr:hypothetical protein [Nitrospirota bacterium]